MAFHVNFFSLHYNCLCSCITFLTITFSCFPARQYCVPNPCKNGGTCIPQEDGYKCNCLSNYEGNDCESKYCGVMIEVTTSDMALGIQNIYRLPNKCYHVNECYYNRNQATTIWTCICIDSKKLNIFSINRLPLITKHPYVSLSTDRAVFKRRSIYAIAIDRLRNARLADWLKNPIAKEHEYN